MTWLLSVNNILSFLVLMLCWWMAHVSANAGGLWRRLVSLGYGAVGLTTLGIAMFRTLVEESEWFPIIGKVALCALLGLLVIASRQESSQA
jgi:hypothetical protein